MHNASDYELNTGAVSMKCAACGSYEPNCCDGYRSGLLLEQLQNARAVAQGHRDDPLAAALELAIGYFITRKDRARDARDPCSFLPAREREMKAVIRRLRARK